MTQPSAEKDTVLVDVSGIALDVLLRNSEGPLLESLRRLDEEAEHDVTAGFAQGLS